MKKSEGYLQTNGGKIFYKTYGSIDSRVYPLILIHGGPGFSHDPLQVLQPLANHRFLILYDQLGCGRSDKPSQKALWTIARSTTELHDVITHFTLDKYHVLGHSFGGSVALEHGLTFPQGLQSLILSSPLISINDWLADTTMRKQELPPSIQKIIDTHETANSTDSEAYKNAVQAFNRRFLCRLDPKPTIYENAIKNFNTEIYATMWGSSEFHCTGNLSSYERAQDLYKLDVPTLLLCGDQDEVLENTLQRYLQSLTKHSQLCTLKNSSHSTYLEATNNFIDAVNSFLQRMEGQ